MVVMTVNSKSLKIYVQITSKNTPSVVHVLSHAMPNQA
jgi:hypothetical protein